MRVTRLYFWPTLSVGTRLTRVAWTNDQEGLSPGKYEIVVKGHN